MIEIQPSYDNPKSIHLPSVKAERATVLQVNLSAVKHNLKQIRKIIDDRNIIAIVKDNAYGLGGERIATTLQDNGVRNFGIILLQEGAMLRAWGITENVILLTPFWEEELEDLFIYNITPTIMDYKQALMLNKAAIKKGRIIDCYFKIDTGMGRYGASYDSARELIYQVIDLSNVRIKGLFSHLATADWEDIEYSQYQIKRFSNFINTLKDSKITFKMNHLANSSGIIAHSNSLFDAVRPGIALYGSYPAFHLKKKIDLRLAATLSSKILYIKEIEAGEYVSYGITYKARKKIRMGIVPIGYADGYLTLFSNKGYFRISNNEYAPIIGRVTMDTTMIDLTDFPHINQGDTVHIIDHSLSPERLAEMTGLIPYELLTNISNRVPRLYFY